MWLPLGWIIDHWIGIFHALVRTAVIVTLWYLFPDNRFTSVPVAIVLIYLVSIFVLLNRKIENTESDHTAND